MSSPGQGQDLQSELAQLERSFRQLRTIFDAFPIPLLVTRRADGTLLLANDEFARLMGVDRSQLLGRPAPEFYANPGDRQHLLEQLTTAGRVRGYEVRIRRPDGALIWVSAAVVAAEIDGDDVIVGGLCEIDDRKRAEQSVQQALNQLEQANLELQRSQSQLVQSEKMAALGSLMAGVAHEINTPVGAISSTHDTLARALKRVKETIDHLAPDLASEPKVLNAFAALDDAARVIHSASSRVSTIVKRLRNFARVDDAEPSSCDLHQGIEDTLVLLHHQIKGRVEVETTFGQLPRIDCFPGQLNQVFLNILVNAAQAIRDRGTITITTALTADGEIEIAFADTGSGIAPEHLERIFEPGFTTKGPSAGTGLGLSICRTIIERHRGNIAVQSALGKGTTFTITLPRRRD